MRRQNNNKRDVSCARYGGDMVVVDTVCVRWRRVCAFCVAHIFVDHCRRYTKKICVVVAVQHDFPTVNKVIFSFDIGVRYRYCSR